MLMDRPGMAMGIGAGDNRMVRGELSPYAAAGDGRPERLFVESGVVVWVTCAVFLMTSRNAERLQITLNGRSEQVKFVSGPST